MIMVGCINIRVHRLAGSLDEDIYLIRLCISRTSPLLRLLVHTSYCQARHLQMPSQQTTCSDNTARWVLRQKELRHPSSLPSTPSTPCDLISLQNLPPTVYLPGHAIDAQSRLCQPSKISSLIPVLLRVLTLLAFLGYMLVTFHHILANHALSTSNVF